MNFQMLQTWQVELWTHCNQGFSTKTERRNLSNPSKKPKLHTCLAKKELNLGSPNMKVQNFELFQTHIQLQKLSHEPIRTLHKSQN